MADKKVSTRRQSVEKIVYQRPLGKFVEIDHDISTKNNVEQETLGQRVHKIKPLEINHIPDLFFDTVITGPLAGPLLKIFFQQDDGIFFVFSAGYIPSVAVFNTTVDMSVASIFTSTVWFLRHSTVLMANE